MGPSGLWSFLNTTWSWGTVCRMSDNNAVDHNTVGRATSPVGTPPSSQPA